MHAGPKIIEVKRTEDEEWVIDILTNFVEHKSMNYASAGRPRRNLEGKVTSLVIVSTSFYDKKLCVWEYVIHRSGE